MTLLSLQSSTANTDPVLECLKNIGLGVLYLFEADFWEKQWLTVILSVLYFTAGYMFTCKVMDIQKHEERRRAWVMTFYSGFLTSPVGVYLAAQLFFRSMEKKAFAQEFIFESHPAATFCTVFFIVYMVMDIAVGLFEYPTTFEVMNWIHHIGYSIFLLNTLKWNFTNSFGIFLMAEIPTIVLSLGHVKKEWRQDVLFGSLFFFIRIVYHSIVSYFVTVDPYQPIAIWPLAWLILAMHINWWVRWCIGMVRRSGIEMTLRVHLDELAEIARQDASITQKMTAFRDKISVLTYGKPLDQNAVGKSDPLSAEAFLQEAAMVEQAAFMFGNNATQYGSVQRTALNNNEVILGGRMLSNRNHTHESSDSSHSNPFNGSNGYSPLLQLDENNERVFSTLPQGAVGKQDSNDEEISAIVDASTTAAGNI